MVNFVFEARIGYIISNLCLVFRGIKQPSLVLTTHNMDRLRLVHPKTDGEWDERREVIERLYSYWDEQKGLGDVMAIMKADHGFAATYLLPLSFPRL